MDELHDDYPAGEEFVIDLSESYRPNRIWFSKASMIAFNRAVRKEAGSYLNIGIREIL